MQIRVARVVAAGLWATTAAGCASILGIDELGEGKPPDAAVPDAAIVDAGADVPDAVPADAYVQPPCTADLPEFDRRLCGPPELPCRIQDHDTLDPPAFRNDAPAVLVDGQCVPQVVFSVAENGFHGFHATVNDDGTWSAVETPFPIATVSALATPDGTPHLLAYDGAFNASLHSLDANQADGWTDALVPAEVYVSARALARTPDGRFHAAIGDQSGEVIYARYIDTWQITRLSEEGTGRTHLTLSPAGIPQLAWWSAAGGDWLLRWKPHPGVAETATTLGSASLPFVTERIGISASVPDAQNPAGRPHISFARKRLDNVRISDLVYLTRRGASNWDAVLIDTDEIDGASFCNHQPQSAGEVCELRQDELAPIGLVATASGSVRILYARHRLEATMISQCMPPPSTVCGFTIGEDRSSAELMIAWVDDALAVGRASVGAVPLIADGTIVIDRVGSLHLAVYGRAHGDNETSVHYLRVGP